MMSDAAAPSPRKKRASGAAKRLTPEQARAAILAKLQKGAAKGALLPPPKDETKAAVFAEAFAAMEAGQEVFADRRKAKARFYLWALRPAMPTTESVAKKLELIATERFPAVATEADLKNALAKDEQPLLGPALIHALEERLLVCLLLRTGKTAKSLFASASALFNARWKRDAPEPAEEVGFNEDGRQFTVIRQGPGPDWPPLPAAVNRPLRETVRAAYEDLVRRTGFPAVNISRLHAESGASLGELKQWLLEEYRAGRAVLSEGDWSLATDEERNGMIELHGQRCILARLLS